MNIISASADNVYFIIRGNRNTVGKGSWKGISKLKPLSCLVKPVNIGVPFFGTTFPRTLVWKVGSAHAKQLIFTYSRKHACKAFFVRKRRKRCPCKRMLSRSRCHLQK